jgi:hypothetical protein
MSNEKKRSFYSKFSISLQNLYYVGTLVTLCFIMAQVYYSKRIMSESSEWEKAKMTIENVDQFKNNLTKVKLYETETWALGDGSWPDFSIEEGRKLANMDSLYGAYGSLFSTEKERDYDFHKTLDIMNSFAYPIIMGYASEIGSFHSAIREYYTLSSFIMPYAYNLPIGHHAKLLYRLWRVRTEQVFLERHGVEMLKNAKYLIFVVEDEITEESVRLYERKLEKELKKRQQEIEIFRKQF